MSNKNQAAESLGKMASSFISVSSEPKSYARRASFLIGIAMIGRLVNILVTLFLLYYGSSLTVLVFVAADLILLLLLSVGMFGAIKLNVIALGIFAGAQILLTILSCVFTTYFSFFFALGTLFSSLVSTLEGQVGTALILFLMLAFFLIYQFLLLVLNVLAAHYAVKALLSKARGSSAATGTEAGQKPSFFAGFTPPAWFSKPAASSAAATAAAPPQYEMGSPESFVNSDGPADPPPADNVYEAAAPYNFNDDGMDYDEMGGPYYGNDNTYNMPAVGEAPPNQFDDY